MAAETMGERLQALKARSGLSLEAIAKAAGFKGRSSVQRYFEPQFTAERLDFGVAERLAKALAGTGEPPIDEVDILSLAGRAFEIGASTVLPPRYMDLPRDVPVYTTALGTFQDDEAIEQTNVDMSTPLDYFMRPVGLANRQGVYGVYIVGESQSPRFEPGEIAFADPKQPPRIGDDVIVYLRKQLGEDEEEYSAVLIKRLVRQTARHIELRQFNPEATFSLDVKRVQAMHRVMTNAELWAGYR